MKTLLIAMGMVGMMGSAMAAPSVPTEVDSFRLAESEDSSFGASIIRVDHHAPVSSFPASLLTSSMEEGFALAVKLSRLGVKSTQPDMEILKEQRQVYSRDGDSLIAASHVIAVHFQTIAAANKYWRP